MENPEAPKRHGWSIVRKAQIIGALIGALGTIGALLLWMAIPNDNDSNHWMQPKDILLVLVVVPAGLFCKAFGISLHLYKDTIGTF